MRATYDTVRNERVNIYDNVDEFLIKNPDYDSLRIHGAVYRPMSYEYPGCSGCEDCEAILRLARDNDTDVIVNTHSHDVVALVDKE